MKTLLPEYGAIVIINQAEIGVVQSDSRLGLSDENYISLSLP